MKGLSLFASAGIGETYLSEIGLDIVVSNELIQRRSDLHQKLYPDCHSPANAKKLLDDALEAEYIEPTPSNNPLGVLAYKQRYKITKRGLD